MSADEVLDNAWILALALVSEASLGIVLKMLKQVVVKRELSTTAIKYTKELLRTPKSLQERFKKPSLAYVITDRADCPWSSSQATGPNR